MYSPRLLVHVKEVQENEGEEWGGSWEGRRDDLGMEVMEEGQQYRVKRRERDDQSRRFADGPGSHP